MSGGGQSPGPGIEQSIVSNPNGRSLSPLFMSTVGIASVTMLNSTDTNNNATLTVDCEALQQVDADEKDVFPDEILKNDTYGGITLDVNKLTNATDDDHLDPKQFATTLENSLQLWKENGKRGIWIHIPTKCSSIIPLCTELGFEFQYAKKNMLVMTKWLPEDSHSRLPHGPTHQVGIGAVILHPVTGQMLVVQEKTGPAAARKLWKMPTGLTDPGEDVVDAAIREAKEETGLDVEFDRIICMRQAHGGIFNQSDMFFVCLLNLKQKYKKDLVERGQEIPLTPQEEEIAEVAWMDMEEYANQSLWLGSPLYEEMNNVMIQVRNTVVGEAKGQKNTDDEAGRNGSLSRDDENNDGKECNLESSKDESHCGFIAKNLPVGFRPGSNTIYLSRL